MDAIGFGGFLTGYEKKNEVGTWERRKKKEISAVSSDLVNARSQASGYLKTYMYLLMCLRIMQTVLIPFGPVAVAY